MPNDIKAREEEYIVCAAVWFNDGKEYPHQPVPSGVVITGMRHHNCFNTMAIVGGSGLKYLEYGERKQGFMTNKHRFVDREEAARIAYESGQIKEPVKALFSEYIY